MADDTSRAEQEVAPTDLTTLLEQIRHAGEGEERVSLEAILDSVGQRSFAPFLLIAGLITLAPLIGDLPGVPTLMATLVVLSSGQLLARRKHVWFPRWLLTRQVSRERFQKGLDWMMRPASWVDRLLKPRLSRLTRPPANLPVALTCLLIAMAMPPMEFVPFTANGAGLALTLFGLALLADDGLLVLLGYAFTAATLTLVIVNLV
ncbi:exopolysaccharide biosynthesis protein [Halomonas sp. TRM85114]|uniref:exopolysaccharide biosynthesis protein n=1 Tax=Halomonas jincaotanensis TaxID=2810616 RepID=UPI001BD28A93|nr:exopolysaccharide biosynthesis protein [Halomonas jincaotanensis]MBS9403640.1 exopolysaccharide biosynthesis protein [Halomonas jincaotanensis]